MGNIELFICFLVWGIVLCIPAFYFLQRKAWKLSFYYLFLAIQIGLFLFYYDAFLGFHGTTDAAGSGMEKAFALLFSLFFQACLSIIMVVIYFKHYSTKTR